MKEIFSAEKLMSIKEITDEMKEELGDFFGKVNFHD
jgi:hypothetical protein